MEKGYIKRRDGLADKKLGIFELNRPLHRNVFIVLMVCVFTIGCYLRWIDRDVISRSPDERIYMYYSNSVMENGFRNGIRKVVREFNSDTKLREYPTPIRIAYIHLLSLSRKLTNKKDFSGGTLVSFIFSVLSLLVLMRIGFRFFNPWVALFSLLFLCVSPIELSLSKRVWQDGLLTFFGGMLLYLSCEIHRNPRQWALYFLFSLLGSYVFLIKEFGLIVYALCLSWLIWKLYRGGFKAQVIVLISVGIVLTCGSFIILVDSVGGLSAFIAVIKNKLLSEVNNAYSLQYQSGPWYSLIESFWLLSPYSLILALIGCALAMIMHFKPKFGAFLQCQATDSVFFLTIYVIAFIALFTVLLNLKNLRLLSPVFIPFYLMSGLGLWGLVAICSLCRRKVFFSFLLIIFLSSVLFVVLDYRNFVYVFEKIEVNDPVNHHLSLHSIYNRRDVKSSSYKKFRSHLLKQIPNQEAVLASFEFLPLLEKVHPAYSFHHILKNSDEQFLRRNIPLDKIKYALIDLNDQETMDNELFAGSKSCQVFFTEQPWQITDFAEDILCLKKGVSDFSPLYLVNPTHSEEPAIALKASVADEVELKGCTMTLGKDFHEGQVKISFYWRVINKPTNNYGVVFIWEDLKGNILFQKFHHICYRFYPTKDWQKGDIIVEHYWLIIPPGLPQTEVQLRLSLVNIGKNEPMKFTTSQANRIDSQGFLLIEDFEPVR